MLRLLQAPELMLQAQEPVQVLQGQVQVLPQEPELPQGLPVLLMRRLLLQPQLHTSFR